MSSVGDQLKLQLPSWINMMQIIGFSKDFFELVRDIGEAKSKEEEERIIKNEAQKLKVVMSQPDQSKKMKEYLIRAIYCVMLGHDIPFAYVHALTMTQDPKMINKRTGFLAVSLCLHENHELLLMVVNSIQKLTRDRARFISLSLFIQGLLSTNYLEVCSALIALCKLINADTIPAFLPTVVNLLSHTKAAVRKKACMAIHRFWLKSPESISHLSDKLRVVLCDRDASVMAASLCLFLDMARVDPTPFKDLIPSFVSILKQVSENRLPRSYEYHQVPAPWIQINLLKLLALLGADDQAASEHMYEVLLQAMQRAEKYKNNAGYAVLYEAIMATTRIRANTALLEAAANSIGQLIRVRNHNLKYLGIQALAAIVRVAPRFVAPHQMEVIECLESTDESIKRKTLDLLYRMTNTKNVVVIVAKLIEYLQNTVATDELVRAELVSRINELAERYAPNNHWYIDTMNVMLQVGGAHVRPEVAYNLIRLISQDNGNSEDEDIQLRHYAVSVFLKSLESGEPLPDMHVQVLSWVVSEYGYLATSDSSISLDGIVARFADLMERPHTDIKTRGWILTGLLKLAAQLDHIPPSILSLIQKYTRSRYPDLMMRAYEFLALIHNPVLMGEALPVDASCEDLEVDPTLSFLNAHANRGIANGTFKPYIPKEMRTTRASTTTSSLLFPVVTPAVVTGSTRKELNFSYPAPPVPSPLVHSGAVSPLLSTPAVSTVSAPLATLQPALDTPSSSQQLKVQNSVWTREGFVGKGISNTINPTTAATPIPVPSLTSNPLVLKPITSTQPQQAKLNEKQASLASQLFSGLAVSSGSASVPAKTTPAPSKPAPKPRNTPQTSKSTSSLFPPPTSTTTTQPSSAYTSVPASPTRTPMPSSAENFLIDLGDLSSAFSSSSLKSSTPLKSSASTSTPASPQTPHAFTPPASSPVPTRPNTHSPILAPSLMDDIPSQLPAVAGAPDTLLSPSAPLASQITPGSSFEVSNLTYTPFMGSIMDGSPTTAYERIGKEDELLQVGCVKVLRAQETLLVFMLSNKSPTYTLSEVTTTVQIPDHFSAELSADPLVRINAKTFSLAALPTSRTVLEVISLKHKKHGYNLAVTSQVQYTWEGRRTNVSDRNVPLEICDFLRPHPITIDLVGNLWALHTHESKAKFTPATSVASSSALLTRLKTDLFVHTVQVIGNEGIAAASLLNGELLLMHVVVAVAAGAAGAVDVTSTVTVTVRSKDKSFTEVVIRYLHRLLR